MNCCEFTSLHTSTPTQSLVLFKQSTIHSNKRIIMINIHELNRRRREKHQRDLEIYHRVLKRCHNRIRLSAHKMGTQCVFTVPQYIAGLPLYSLRDCISFLKQTLRQNGFKVKNLNFDQLFISWKHIPLGEDHTNNVSHTDHSTSTQYQRPAQRSRTAVLHPSSVAHPSHRPSHTGIPSVSLSNSVADLCPPQQTIRPAAYRDIREEIIRADSILYGNRKA